MNSLSLSYTIIACTIVLIIPIKIAILPLLFTASLIPGSAGIHIGLFSFSVLRILLIFYTFRIITKKETTGFTFNRVDKAVLIYAIAVLMIGFIPRADLSFIYRLGQIYDLAGFYFTFRILVKTKETLVTTMCGLAVFCIILACFMIYEQVNASNLLGHFGGPLRPALRDGRIRAQGAFAHAILAGTVGATSAGIFLGSWFEKNGLKWLHITGMISSLVIVWASASSGPVMSAFFLAVGVATWHLRHRMSMIRWSIVILVFSLHLFMKVPVWYLISRIDITGSSTGWHRSEIINSAIKYFNEWWLVGTDYTRHWMRTGVSWSPLHTDITNQYIREGVRGGMLQLTLYIVIIVRAFKYVGYVIGSLEIEKKSEQFTMWCLGAVLFTHVATFFSVGYFDQSNLFYILNIALIASGGFLLNNDTVASSEL